jgi:hypothetical protein
MSETRTALGTSHISIAAVGDVTVQFAREAGALIDCKTVDLWRFIVLSCEWLDDRGSMPPELLLSSSVSAIWLSGSMVAVSV